MTKLNFAFICVFSILLLYGSGLYVSTFIALEFSEKIRQKQYHRFSEAGADFEKEFIRELSDKKHSLLSGLSKMKWQLLQTAFIPKVEKGKEGWMFLKEEQPGRNVVFQSLGIQHYDAIAFKQWRLLFEQRAEWTRAQGIPYLLVVSPNKASIYPEYLPEKYKRSRPGALDQLLAALPGIDILDLRDSLRRKKHYGRLYEKTDTHWNELGAFAAYQSLINSLPEAFRDVPKRLEDCRQFTQIAKGGDLARLLLMDEKLMEEKMRVLLNDTLAIFMEEGAQPLASHLVPKTYSRPGAALPKVVFLHDSFGEMLIPYLAEHFETSVFLWEWQGFNTDLILREKPELVVNQIVERAVLGDKKRNDWRAIQHYWQQHFAALSSFENFREVKIENICSILENSAIPSGKLPIIKLTVSTEKKDKLIVEYENEKGYYWVSEGKVNTFYLEYEKDNILSIEPQAGYFGLVDVELRLY